MYSWMNAIVILLYLKTETEPGAHAVCSPPLVVLLCIRMVCSRMHSSAFREHDDRLCVSLERPRVSASSLCGRAVVAATRSSHHDCPAKPRRWRRPQDSLATKIFALSWLCQQLCNGVSFARICVLSRCEGWRVSTFILHRLHHEKRTAASARAREPPATPST